jgi:5-methylcytosine-specific restriction endonuclease McrA
VGKIKGVAKKFQGKLLNQFDNKLNKKTKSFLIRKSDKCALCGEQILTMKDATIDHIVPLSKGGINSVGNMQLAHLKCNLEKGNKCNN